MVLPVLRRHWALHARRCPGAAPEKRNALERTYDAFAETAATQWAKLQDAPRHSPKDYARRTIQTLLDASRDPDEQFLVELGGGPTRRASRLGFPRRLDERLVRRRLAKLAAAREERAFVAEPGLAGHGARARAARRHADNQMADRLRVLALAGERPRAARRRVPRDRGRDLRRGSLARFAPERAARRAVGRARRRGRWRRRRAQTEMVKTQRDGRPRAACGTTTTSPTRRMTTPAARCFDVRITVTPKVADARPPPRRNRRPAPSAGSSRAATRPALPLHRRRRRLPATSRSSSRSREYLNLVVQRVDPERRRRGRHRVEHGTRTFPLLRVDRREKSRMALSPSFWGK